MQEEVKKRLTDKMEKALASLKKELAAIRTGRASLAIFDGVNVDYYGTPTPINQVATMAVPESRLITIQPWEPKMVSEIERAILKSDLGLNPSNDGKTIRIAIPQLTEERRSQIIKHVHKKVEEARIAIRNIRRDGNDEIKKLEKDKHISEDDVRKTLDDIQKMTDTYIKRAEEIQSHKEKELKEI